MLRAFKSSVLIAIGLAAAACVQSQGSNSVHVRPIDKNESLDEVRNGDIDPALAGLSNYAMLAADGYREANQPLLTCNGYRSTPWVRLVEFSETKPPLVGKRLRHIVPGLAYSVWKDTTPRGRRRIAIVFRGTNFDESGDWYTNARWLTRMNLFTYDQYQQVRDRMADLREGVEKKFGKNIEVVAVGHSLGGGLAQHAAYSLDWIKTVYAFNTSPVTAITSSAVTTQARKGVSIFRAYEAGEVLANIRSVARRIVPLRKADPKVVELRFNFRSTFRPGSVGGGPISQHSMLQLACDLTCWVDKRGDRKSCNIKFARQPLAKQSEVKDR